MGPGLRRDDGCLGFILPTAQKSPAGLPASAPYSATRLPTGSTAPAPTSSAAAEEVGAGAVDPVGRRVAEYGADAGRPAGDFCAVGRIKPKHPSSRRRPGPILSFRS